MANVIQTPIAYQSGTPLSGTHPFHRVENFHERIIPKPVSPIDELAAGLFWKPEDIVLMIWGYFDESYKHDNNTGRPVLSAIGGALASLETWQTLSAEWDKALNGKVSMFHMKDFEAGEKQFKNLTVRERESLLNSLMEIIDRYDQISFVGVVKPTPESKRPVRDSYIESLKKVIPRAVMAAGSIHSESVHLVFAKFPELSFERIGRYCDGIALAMPYLKGCTGQDPLGCPPLQVADIVAYEVSHASRDRRMRDPMRRLRKRHPFYLYPDFVGGSFGV